MSTPQMEPKDIFDTYGEPCNNCQHCEELVFCNKGHRIKMITTKSGHIPEIGVRRKGGCSDHLILTEGRWIGDDRAPYASEYGGVNTNILISW